MVLRPGDEFELIRKLSRPREVDWCRVRGSNLHTVLKSESIAVAYTLRGSVFANFTSDGRNRDRGASILHFAARIKASDKGIKSLVTGGG
jgi:hypothetical protein